MVLDYLMSSILNETTWKWTYHVAEHPDGRFLDEGIGRGDGGRRLREGRRLAQRVQRQTGRRRWLGDQLPLSDQLVRSERGRHFAVLADHVVRVAVGRFVVVLRYRKIFFLVPIGDCRVGKLFILFGEVWIFLGFEVNLVSHAPKLML